MKPLTVSDIPPSDQKKPGALKQFMIFLHRNIKTKITNIQYLVITLSEAPLLAVICALLTRYAPPEGYTIMNNKNLVSYFFMAVIVATFTGMSGSAEEIRSMLLTTFPAFPDRNDIDIFAQLKPAKEVGGDLYDYYIRDEKLFFCVGDVSGKGIPASLIMVVTQALFRTAVAHQSNPGKIISGINDISCREGDSSMFTTLFVGVLDLPTGRLRYSNAAHNGPILINNSEITSLPCDPNIPVGLDSWKFTTQEVIISPQTTIFLYTDGLTEAENLSHEQFEEERIFEVARQTEGQPQILIEKMTKAVEQFVGNAEQSDDLTMLAIMYTKQSEQDARLQRSITLINDVEQVPELTAFVEEVCEELNFDMDTTMSLNLAIEEAVVNVMEYAYPADTKGEIKIEALANSVRLKFVISDWGKPFDPTSMEEVDTTLSVEERPIGGLGIHLVRQIMDSLNYERIDGKNVLTLRKKLV